jgi:ABC-type transport system substrate-binding protein
VLKFIPQSDLSVLDPVWSAAYVVRNHGMMVFDTLYGMDSSYQIQPQMAAGHRVEDDGKTWLITLRDGLAWHDGEKVLARDCVASIRRWGARDSFGQTLMAATQDVGGDGRPHHPVPSETTVPVVNRRAGQSRLQRLRDDAGTAGFDRPVQTGQRDDRQRTVPLCRLRPRSRLA